MFLGVRGIKRVCDLRRQLEQGLPFPAACLQWGDSPE